MVQARPVPYVPYRNDYGEDNLHRRKAARRPARARRPYAGKASPPGDEHEHSPQAAQPAATEQVKDGTVPALGVVSGHWGRVPCDSLAERTGGQQPDCAAVAVSPNVIAE